MVAVLYVLSFIVMWPKKKNFRSKSGIRVVKKGKIPTKKVECLHCHSIIEYDTMKVEHQPKMRNNDCKKLSTHASNSL